MNNRRRARRTILAAGAGTLLLPLAQLIFAQPNRKAKRLGMLFVDAKAPPWLEIAVARLAELGWIENQTLLIERTSANNDRRRFPKLASDLVRSGADVITVDTMEAAVAASQASTSVPIVLSGVGEPVERGLIESYARPGRNITGVSASAGPGIAGKRLGLLKEIVPRARRLAWITPVGASKDAKGTVDFSRIEADARKAGYEPMIYPVSERENLDEIFREILSRHTEVLSVGTSAFLRTHMERIVRFANNNRLPSGYAEVEFVEAGGLLSYGRDLTQMARTIGEYIDRVLRGANPATTPVEQASQFVTALNLKTAKLIRVTVPQSVLLRADHVVR